jgi:hypothetical protein
MKREQLLTVAVIVGVIAVVDQLTKGVEAVTNVNEGTPFEDTGVVGTLGNVTNQASGGVLANIGSAIGGFAADIRERILGIEV